MDNPGMVELPRQLLRAKSIDTIADITRFRVIICFYTFFWKFISRFLTVHLRSSAWHSRALRTGMLMDTPKNETVFKQL